MTLHTHCFTPAYDQFSCDHAHLLKAEAAGIEHHARLAAAGY